MGVKYAQYSIPPRIALDLLKVTVWVVQRKVDGKILAIYPSATSANDFCLKRLGIKWGDALQITVHDVR